jgi:hypothetical protein
MESVQVYAFPWLTTSLLDEIERCVRGKSAFSSSLNVVCFDGQTLQFSTSCGIVTDQNGIQSALIKLQVDALPVVVNMSADGSVTKAVLLVSNGAAEVTTTPVEDIVTQAIEAYNDFSINLAIER